MKKFLTGTLIALTLNFAATAVHAGMVDLDCTYNGKFLAGKVQVVDSLPDFKVQQVKTFQDLSVKKVNSSPKKCGQWQFVESFPDFKIQFVDDLPDFTIKYVDSFPGVR